MVRRSVTMAVMSAAGVTSKAGLRGSGPRRRRAHTSESADLVRPAILDLDVGTGGRRGSTVRSGATTMDGYARA